MSVAGPLGEVLLQEFPELGERVAELIREDDRFLEGLEEDPEEIAQHELSAYHLSTEFATRLLVPAIEGYPDSVAEIRRCVEFMDKVFRRYPNPDNHYHAALGIRAIERLTQHQRDILRAVGPELQEEIRITES